MKMTSQLVQSQSWYETYKRDMLCETGGRWKFKWFIKLALLKSKMQIRCKH